MKICDLTQFYSPLSGGVKRYVHEKINYLQNATNADEHVLIIPGAKTELTSGERSQIYTIHSPLLSRSSRYRALLNLRAVHEILERERPDIIESGDPYQVAWKALSAGESLGIPVVGFYHSHFPEAYLRSSARFFGATASEIVMKIARGYVRGLYNRFAATLVPSPQLAMVLQEWGVNNARLVSLGVNIDVFRPDPDDARTTRDALGIPPRRLLLLYVGRLSQEKNTHTLFQSFELLARRPDHAFHLLVIGDGAQREQLQRLKARTERVTWFPYCPDSHDLARMYRAADLFVHPGIQETFGFVSLESQACGTPVVGIHGSYMDRIILHEQELWARENTPEALADAILELSEEKLHAIGARASRQAREKHAWSQVFEELFCIYRQVCSNYRRNPSA